MLPRLTPFGYLPLLLTLCSPMLAQAQEPQLRQLHQTGRRSFDRHYARAINGGAGACLTNSHALAKAFVRHGIKPAKLRLLYIDAKRFSQHERFVPRPWALRSSERHGKSFSYHVALMTQDQRVFDLSAHASLWGADLRTYNTALFGRAKDGPKGLQLISTPIEQFDYAVEHYPQSGSYRLNSRLWGEVGFKTGGGVTTPERLEQQPPEQIYTRPGQ